MKVRKNIRWKEMDKSRIELSQLINHFESFNWSEGKSPKTVEWYNNVLTLLLNWLQSSGNTTQLGAIENQLPFTHYTLV